jgi:hypothetical protein
VSRSFVCSSLFQFHFHVPSRSVVCHVWVVWAGGGAEYLKKEGKREKKAPINGSGKRPKMRQIAWGTNKYLAPTTIE